MSRKHQYEPSYSNYAFDDTEHIPSKRDEYGLYYKKHRESGPRYKKKTYLTLLTGHFKVKYEDGEIEEFIINDSESAVRENNEIASNSPLAIGAHRHNLGEYFEIPGGRVLLVEKDLEWLEIPKSKRDNPYKNIKWSTTNSNTSNNNKIEPIKDPEKENVATKKEEKKVTKKRKKKQTLKTNKKEENIIKNEHEISGLIPKIEHKDKAKIEPKEEPKIDYITEKYNAWKEKKKNSNNKKDNEKTLLIIKIIIWIILFSLFMYWISNINKKMNEEEDKSFITPTSSPTIDKKDDFKEEPVKSTTSNKNPPPENNKVKENKNSNSNNNVQPTSTPPPQPTPTPNTKKYKISLKYMGRGETKEYYVEEGKSFTFPKNDDQNKPVYGTVHLHPYLTSCGAGDESISRNSFEEYKNDGWEMILSPNTKYKDGETIYPTEDIYVKPSFIKTGNIIPAEFPTYSKEGYTFGGWYTGANCGGTKLDISAYEGSSTMNLYACWIEE